MKPQTLEQRLLHTLTNPQPQPKYPLWQQVEFKYGERAELSQGHIVGYYWESVEVAIHAEGCPGWWYVIEGGNPEWVYHVLQEDITPVEGGSDEADRP